MDGGTSRGRLGRLAAVAAVVVALSGCWPAAGQGPDRSAYNPFETVITPRTVRTLAPVWTATTDRTGGVVGPPVVSNGGVHVSDSAAVYTFDRATGARLWEFPEPRSFPGTVGDPIADGGRVLYTSGTPVGFGGAWFGFTGWFDARTGAELDGPDHGNRIVARRGTILAGYSMEGGPDGGIYVDRFHVSDVADPTAGWSGIVHFSIGGAGAAPSATVGAQRLYHAGTVTVSFDPVVDVTGVRAYPMTARATCADPPEGLPAIGTIPCPLWSTPTAGRPVTSPVLGPGESVLYVGTDDGALLALDTADGNVLWSAALGAVPSADPALAEGWLYLPLANGDLVVVPSVSCGSATCGPAWRAHLGGAGVQPAVAGGVVLVGTDAGDLVALRAAGCRKSTCHPLWQRNFGAAVTGAPAVTGGQVYIGVAPDKVVGLAGAQNVHA